MHPERIIQLCQHIVLEEASKLYGVSVGEFQLVPDYEGATNIVYEYVTDGKPRILRISYKPERTLAQIQSELHFVNYLAENGVRVSVPVQSAHGELVETVWVEGIPYQLVSFEKGKGMRVPDNGYQYRPDAPIEEYFQSWGQVLGQMHRLAKAYQPPDKLRVRPEWFEFRKERFTLDILDEKGLFLVRERIQSTISEIKMLPPNRNTYGLIHGDFNDGNFTVDYSNGDITVFDFDDACYFWYLHELASAWEGGVGRTMFEGVDKRKAFMDHYMAQVMEGYERENSLPDGWQAQLPIFITLVQIDELLYYLRYVIEPGEDVQAGIRYKVKCLEEQIPYMGFFDSIYSPDKPFAL